MLILDLHSQLCVFDILYSFIFILAAKYWNFRKYVTKEYKLMSINPLKIM